MIQVQQGQLVRRVFKAFRGIQARLVQLEPLEILARQAQQEILGLLVQLVRQVRLVLLAIRLRFPDLLAQLAQQALTELSQLVILRASIVFLRLTISNLIRRMPQALLLPSSDGITAKVRLYLA